MPTLCQHGPGTMQRRCADAARSRYTDGGTTDDGNTVGKNPSVRERNVMEPQADIGLVGLAVMGRNLVLNLNDHGFRVAVYNRTTARMTDFV